MKNNKVFKKLFFIFFTIAVLFGYMYIKASYMFPNKITLIKGTESTFDFNTPLSVGLTIDKQGILKVNGNDIDGNYNINLKKPIKFEPNQIGNVNLELKLFGKIPLRNVSVNIMPEYNVIPCGKTVGVKINTKGILVVGKTEIKGVDSKEYKPYRDSNIREGDTILYANDKKIDSISDFSDIVLNSKGKKIKLRILRNTSIIDTNITPVKCIDNNKYKVGLWVRDSTCGIGTMTFYEPDSKQFAALGHGIIDIDTDSLLTVEKGEVLESNITSIIKGKKGIPGELKGTFSENDIKGNILDNTNFGIYGTLNDENNLSNNQAIPVALRNEVQVGSATILSNIDGKKVESYNIEIQRVIKNNYNTSKSMVIKVTDPKLIESTGGIVQGMSGSPIIQNGKLVGAVTHVFVNDSTKGYGIFAELMLQNLKKLERKVVQ